MVIGKLTGQKVGPKGAESISGHHLIPDTSAISLKSGNLVDETEVKRNRSLVKLFLLTLFYARPYVTKMLRARGPPFSDGYHLTPDSPPLLFHFN